MITMEILFLKINFLVLRSVLERIEMNNNNGNTNYTYLEILNLFFIRGKCNRYLVELAECIAKTTTVASNQKRKIYKNRSKFHAFGASWSTIKSTQNYSR